MIGILSKLRPNALNIVCRCRENDCGLCTTYEIIPQDMEHPPAFTIAFQDGTRGEAYSRTGVTESDLLEVVRDRLRRLSDRAQQKYRQQYARALLQVMGALQELQGLEGQ